MEHQSTHAHDLTEISQKFRSKQDIITFLRFNRGYFLPSHTQITMRFLRDFFAGNKQLMKSANVLRFNVPFYEELSVIKILEQVKNDDEIMSYLNIYPDYQRIPDRKYFYGILGTLHPNYVNGLIKHANRQRSIAESEELKQEQIVIRDDIFQKLQAEPFYSKTRGKGVFLLKQKAKPRSQRQKRQIHEVSQFFSDYKVSSDLGGPRNIEFQRQEDDIDLVGKRQMDESQME